MILPTDPDFDLAEIFLTSKLLGFLSRIIGWELLVLFSFDLTLLLCIRWLYNSHDVELTLVFAACLCCHGSSCLLTPSPPSFPPSHCLLSCWKTSQMSCGPISPCTLTKKFWSCRCLRPLVAAACARCRCTSRRPSAPPGSTSCGRATLSKPSFLSARALWRCWRIAPCWPS